MGHVFRWNRVSLTTKFKIRILVSLESFRRSLDGYMRDSIKLYIENLKWVLKEVSKIIDCLPKPVVITADHGELLGECNLFAQKLTFHS